MTIIRNASQDDAGRLLEIYAPYVLNTAITFEYEVPSIEEFQRRIVQTQRKFPYLVAEKNGEIVGYTYAGVFKARPAYDRCVETSIYIDATCHHQGIGRLLYDALEERLKSMGILNANACISWTDTPDGYLTHESPLFHEKLGYTKVAHFHQCGYKFNRWYDMIWMEKMLGEHI